DKENNHPSFESTEVVGTAASDPNEIIPEDSYISGETVHNPTADDDGNTGRSSIRVDDAQEYHVEINDFSETEAE
ncbi:hypothetical protein M569_03246, partial [Genlisea aurea]